MNFSELININKNRRMLAEGLGIYKDTRLLCKLLLEYGRNVSKVVRFGIYERMTEKSAKALDLVYLANGSMARRVEYIDEYIMIVREIRTFVGIFDELAYLDVRKATNLTKLMDRLLQFAYGWRRSSLGSSQR